MNKYLVIFTLLISPIAQAKEFHIIELDEVRVDYVSFFPGGRDPFITHNGLDNRELGKMLDININTTLFKYGYFRSLIHSYVDAYKDSHTDGQFRSVGLNMELGIRLTPFLDVYAWHYSQHTLDYTSENVGGFPVQDGIGIHLYIFSNQRKDSIINIK
jgi:hypothetical protein